ncbi:CRISPR-associated protein Cas2 [Thiorhodococcus drewsii AZ1]|uniref:CRISPR-associated protein Cas2 n=1 Tax=Thiorhodococcus drewsii AZ1 TaxID=765913 RepID=G2DYQ2_9GAMM|nr:CRISPR-associated endonuclease Cas2 [Thiorhodococcus drewsii]EGV32679.1 CRISPR-associated protein Cas2 [Thiorhodococcus drewsii AZ1]
MKYAIVGSRPARLVVISYDITIPGRARRVRGTLDSLHHAKQYSVYEAMLGGGEQRGVLAEIASCCDFASDLLAAWWPVDGLRLVWREDRLRVDARAGEPCGEPAVLRSNIGNFMVCYDMSDADALRAVAGIVSARTAMIQRSVYWLRAPASELTSLLARCAPLLDQDDRLWAYPLGRSRDLWQIGGTGSSLLPIANHRWRSS